MRIAASRWAFVVAAHASEHQRELGGENATVLWRRGRREHPFEQRPSEIAVTDFVPEHAVESASRDRHRAALPQPFEEAHRDRLAETEHFDAVAQYVVLERVVAPTKTEGLPVEIRRVRASRFHEHGMGELGVDHFVADDPERIGNEIGRRADLNEPKPEMLRDRSRSVLSFDAA
jgi:hypothetical protein